MDDWTWVARYANLAEEAFRRRRLTSDWPSVEELQRWSDQHDGPDPDQALREMPELPGRPRWHQPSHFNVPLRLLRHVPAAQPVVHEILPILQRSLELYLSDEPSPMLESHDKALLEMCTDPEAMVLAGQLLAEDIFSIFGGGSHGEASWNYTVFGPRIREYRDVETVDAYFARQAELATKYGQPQWRSRHQFEARHGRG